MLRISLSDLEQIRNDPIKYKEKRDAGFKPRGTYSYFSALKNAIYEYHTTSSAQLGMDYLETSLEKFKNFKQSEKMVENFHWYVSEFLNSGWPAFKFLTNLTVRLSTQFWDSCKVTGQINRIDINLKSGGYTAWLFRNNDTSCWENELRIPIIQNAVAIELGVDPAITAVGIYDFHAHRSKSISFSGEIIRASHAELEELLRRMGM